MEVDHTMSMRRGRERDVGAREGLKPSPDLLERRVAGNAHEAFVEVRVSLRLRMEVMAGDCFVHVGQVRAEVPQVRLTQSWYGEAGCERFQLGSHDERLEELVRAGVAHAGAVEWGDFDDPDCLEVAQRLSDRRLAGAEFPSGPGLDDAGPRREATVKDRLQEAILDLIAQDTARDRGALGHCFSVRP